MVLRLYTGIAARWAGLKSRIEEEIGATAVEYALMVALIAVVIIAAVVILGNKLNGLFELIGNKLPSGSAPATATP